MLDAYKCSIFEFEDFGEDAILCYQCLLQLNKWIKHEKEIVKIKEQVVAFLCRFTAVPSRKRGQPTDNATELHSPKRKKSIGGRPRRITDASKILVSTMCLKFLIC